MTEIEQIVDQNLNNSPEQLWELVSIDFLIEKFKKNQITSEIAQKRVAKIPLAHDDYFAVVKHNDTYFKTDFQTKKEALINGKISITRFIKDLTKLDFIDENKNTKDWKEILEFIIKSPQILTIPKKYERKYKEFMFVQIPKEIKKEIYLTKVKLFDDSLHKFLNFNGEITIDELYNAWKTTGGRQSEILGNRFQARLSKENGEEYHPELTEGFLKTIRRFFPEKDTHPHDLWEIEQHFEYLRDINQKIEINDTFLTYFQSNDNSYQYDFHIEMMKKYSDIIKIENPLGLLYWKRFYIPYKLVVESGKKELFKKYYDDMLKRAECFFEEKQIDEKEYKDIIRKIQVKEPNLTRKTI